MDVMDIIGIFGGRARETCPLDTLNPPVLPAENGCDYLSNLPCPHFLSRMAPRVSMLERSKVWIVAAAGLVFAQAFASFVLPQSFRLTVFSDLTQCILLLSGTVALLPNLVSTRGRTRLFWTLMTLGLAFWLVYQLLWTYFEVFLQKDVPNPFVGDVVLFLHVVPMMGALALQPHVEQDERTARLGALDFSLLLVWWLYLYLFAVIPWQYAYGSESAYNHNLNVLYLTEKMVFLAGLAALWAQSTGSWKTIYAHWFGASLTYALSSYIANWAIAANAYYTGSFYDVPLVASMAWITGIGLLAYQASPKRASIGPAQVHGVWVARVGMIAVFSLPLFAVWSVFDNLVPARVRTFRLVVTLGAMLFMGAMVFLKQQLLDRELLNLLRTSHQSYEDLRRLQAQLVQSEKLASLGHLVGGAAHELNNPLTAMLGYSELLTTMPMNDEPRGLSEKIGQEVRRTRLLVASLLNFARQAPAEKILLDLNTLVRTAVKLSLPQLRARKIVVRTDLAQHLPRVLGDSNQLLQVCLHLVNNVMPLLGDMGGVLTVSTRCQNDLVVLEFSDCGPHSQDRDPLQTPQPAGQGTGLALSACYSIIQEHKGRMTCPTRPDQGSTFCIELPAADPETAASTGHEKAQPVLALPPTNS